MRRSLPVLVTLFLFVFSYVICAEGEDKLAFESDVDTSVIKDSLLSYEDISLSRSNSSSPWTESISSSVLLRAQGKTVQEERSADKDASDDGATLSAVADSQHKQIDWNYYLSITSPEVGPYMLLYFNEELDEVEYLYPNITLEEFLEDAEPIVYSVFNASWRGQEEELKELLEDLAKRYDYVLFLMVDADSLPKESLSRYLVRELPLFLIFQEGKVMSQVEGYHSSFSSAIEQSLVDILES